MKPYRTIAKEYFRSRGLKMKMWKIEAHNIKWAYTVHDKTGRNVSTVVRRLDNGFPGEELIKGHFIFVYGRPTTTSPLPISENEFYQILKETHSHIKI